MSILRGNPHISDCKQVIRGERGSSRNKRTQANRPVPLNIPALTDITEITMILIWSSTAVTEWVVNIYHWNNEHTRQCILPSTVLVNWCCSTVAGDHLLPQDSADTHFVLLLNVTRTFPIVTCTAHNIFCTLVNELFMDTIHKGNMIYFNVNLILTKY